MQTETHNVGDKKSIIENKILISVIESVQFMIINDNPKGQQYENKQKN